METMQERFQKEEDLEAARQRFNGMSWKYFHLLDVQEKKPKELKPGELEWAERELKRLGAEYRAMLEG